jgi:hypothetical protein
MVGDGPQITAIRTDELGLYVLSCHVDLICDRKALLGLASHEAPKMISAVDIYGQFLSTD